MKAETPLRPAARSVTAITTMTSQMRPCVMKVLDPLSAQPPAARVAVVRMLAASLPEVDSVSPQAPSFSPRASGARNCALLRVRPEQEDVRGAEAVVRRDRQRDGRVDARELLDADAVVDRRHARAAVLLGVLNAQQAERRQLRHQVGGKVLRLVPLADVRADLGFGELAHRAAQQLLLFGRSEVHELSIVARSAQFPPSVSSLGSYRPASRPEPSAGQPFVDTVAQSSVYFLRPAFCTHASRVPSVDHAGNRASLTPDTVCLCLLRSSSVRWPSSRSV